MDDNLEVEELGHQKRHGQASESQWEIDTWYSNASEQACRKAHQLTCYSPDKEEASSETESIPLTFWQSSESEGVCVR